jgi:hypothetical protein
MGDWMREGRASGKRGRKHVADADTPGSPEPFNDVRFLQATAGNSAVSGLLQRAPLQPGDALMDPNADQASANAAVDSPTVVQIPVAAAAPATDTSGDTAEMALFDETVLNPMISLYAVLRDDPPDMDVALSKVMTIGKALWDYQARYEKSNPALAMSFEAVRGWMGRPLEEIRRRVGSVKPMSDRQIAGGIEDTFVDLQSIRNQLK